MPKTMYALRIRVRKLQMLFQIIEQMDATIHDMEIRGIILEFPVDMWT